MSPLPLAIIDTATEYNPVTPEKVLLLQILLRAVRDLSDNNRTIRNAAIVWFSTWENYLPHGCGISYKDVREHIDLLPSQLEHIQRLIGFNVKVINNAELAHARLKKDA